MSLDENRGRGPARPGAMTGSGKEKRSYSHGQPPEFELYDLETDPGEFDNRADDPALRDVRDRLLARILDKWGDADAMDAEIRASQKARFLMREVMSADDRDF